jgi:phosphatidylinositol dimannoside acyltransferase
LSLEYYQLYRLAIWLVTRVPQGFVYFTAGVIAELNFIFNSRSRRGVYGNQARALPAGIGSFQRWRCARAAFRNFAYSVVDFFRLPMMNPQNLDRFVAGINGWEHVRAAMDAGKGGIFVTVHMGSWELGGAYMGMRGVPLTVAALPHQDHRIDQIFLESRLASGMEIVRLGGALRKLEDAVARGRFIGLVADRDVSGHGPRLPFFGEATRVPIGHVSLALSSGAWILPVCIYRQPDGRSFIEIRPPIIPDPAVDVPEDLAQQCLSVLEEFIRARPEQWSSFFDLWHETDLPVA